MSVSAALLLLTTVSGAAPADITPVSLSAEPRVIDLGDSPYNWRLQQGPSASEVNLMKTAQTATCDTVQSTTNINNQPDTVPDCRFD
jgi:hypothetical protein